MTRPRKQTVDYFPHSCRHGKTMFILEQQFGNDGYAFWFKTLEILGETEGHCLICEDLPSWKYLLSRTHLSADKADEILNLLSDLGAIDPDLWRLDKKIWSDHFIENLSFAYRNREVVIPNKPDIACKKSEICRDMPDKSCKKSANEMKGNEMEVNECIASPSNGDALPTATPIPFYSCKHFELDNDFIAKLLQEYPALNQETITAEISKAHDWLDDNPDRHKRRANGHLKNPRTFLKNWLNRAIINPKGQQKGFQGKGIMAWASKQEDL